MDRRTQNFEEIQDGGQFKIPQKAHFCIYQCNILKIRYENNCGFRKH